jgi:redox-sensing transcriptional repressor
VSAAATARRGIPDASVARLPGYLRALTALARDGIVSVSSEELATAAGVSSAMLRKDLSHLGSYGVRGVGYDVERLASEITSVLGLTQDWPVAIVGMGNLGRALDADPRLVGERVADQEVRPMTDLPGLVADDGLAIGVIATPSEGAQQACDDLVAAGVRSVLNFAPAVLAVPDGVVVRKVDLSTELQILAFHGQKVAVPEGVPS